MPSSQAAPKALRIHEGEAGMRCEVYAQAEDVIDEWDALADRTGASPFRRPGWVLSWERHFSRAPVEILGVRRGGRLVALLPFTRRGGVLQSPTNFHTPDFGPLAEDRAAADFLFRSLFSQPHRLASLSYLEEDGDDVAGFLAAAAARGERAVVRPQHQSPYVDLHGMDWSALEGRLDSKVRADLRRRERRLREAGEVEFQVADGRADLTLLLTEGFQIESSEWKARSGTAVDSRADTRNFYREIAGWAVESGMLRLAFLRLDGRPIAFQFGLEDGGCYYFLKGGYDVALRAYSPGKLLARSMLFRAFETGLARFEFLGEAEAWKMEWTNTCRGRIAASAFAAGAIGYGLWLIDRYGRPVAKRVAASCRRWRTRPLRSNS